MARRFNPFQVTEEVTFEAGWNSFPLPMPLSSKIEEVYIQSDGGTNFDVVAISQEEVFSDDVLPQTCGYWAIDVIVAAGNLGYSDAVSAGGYSAGRPVAQHIGLKAVGAGTVTITVKGRGA